MQENGERFYNYPETKKENRVNNKNSCACQKMLHIRVHFPKIAT